MGMLSRIFGRREKPTNVVAPVDAAAGRYVFTESFRVKFRAAQNVPTPLRDELLQICKSDSRVLQCYLLDVLEQPSGNIKFFVELRLDNPDALHEIGPQMQRVLHRYPDFATRFFVGAGTFDGLKDDEAAYRRAT
jgi:hypothetical protein